MTIVAAIRFYQESLSTVLREAGGITVVGAACEAADAFTQVLSLRPDVVLLDAEVRGSRELARALKAEPISTKVVVIAIQETAASVIDWAETGIDGYVDREQSLASLVEAIVSVSRGELHCTPRMGALLLQRVGMLAAQSPRDLTDLGLRTSITAREHQIISLIGRGLSNKRISSELGISVATTKNHVHNILNKLHLRRRSDAAMLLDRPPPVSTVPGP